jgi:LysR family transcriptional regulator for metE and metH
MPAGLEVRHFQLVAAIAETGSLAAASLKLHLTPSALSHQLRDAENRLGGLLFQRRHRRLLLTGAGERMLASARRVLAEIAEVENGRDAADDLIRLSTGCYTVYGWLPPVMRRFQAEHPRVELRIVLEATRQPVRALLAGELDLALTTQVPSRERLSATRLFDDELLLVYDAPREQLDVFTRVLWPAGLEPSRVSRVPLTEALVELVRGGVGVATLPRWILPSGASRKGLAFQKLTRRGVRRRWSAVTREGARPKPLSRFVQVLRDYSSAISPFDS